MRSHPGFMSTCQRIILKKLQMEPIEKRSKDEKNGFWPPLQKHNFVSLRCYNQEHKNHRSRLKIAENGDI